MLVELASLLLLVGTVAVHCSARMRDFSFRVHCAERAEEGGLRNPTSLRVVKDMGELTKDLPVLA